METVPPTTIAICHYIQPSEACRSIHHGFNDLHRSYVCMRNPVEKLKRIVAEHRLQICLHNITLQPSVKRHQEQALQLYMNRGKIHNEYSYHTTECTIKYNFQLFQLSCVTDVNVHVCCALGKISWLYRQKQRIDRRFWQSGPHLCKK